MPDFHQEETEKKLRGNNDKIKPFSYLTKRQKAIFKDILKNLNPDILSNLDTYLLNQTAITIERLESIEKEINSAGEYDYVDKNNKNKKGYNLDAKTIINLKSVRDMYSKDFFRCCNELSLSPQARAKISINTQPTKKKTLMDIICLCSFCPNMTDLGFTSADNNSALEKKFFGLQQYIATFEGDFLEGLTRRWRIILEKFNKEKSKTYDFRDIEVKLNRNLPSDKATDITNALKVRGLLPDETVINLLNLDLDATSELAKMDLQNEENIQKNLQQMQIMGQAGVEQDNKEDKQDDKVTDLTDTQKAQKLTADDKKEQAKVVNKQINKE